MLKKAEKPVKPTGDASCEDLPEQYRQLLAELQEQDVSLIARHLSKFNAYRALSDLVEVGIDIAARRAELAESTDPEVKVYGSKVVPICAVCWGIPESTIFHVAGTADLLGASALRKLVEDAGSRGVKLTYSHLRELNCLSRTDHTEFIQEMLEKLLDGRVLTHRQVKEEVETFLGRKRVTVSRPTDDQFDEERALDRADARDGDALDDISTPAEINAVCNQFVEMLQHLDKKLIKITEKITAWKEDVVPETLETMCMDKLDFASSVSAEYANRIRDVGLLLDASLQLVTDVLKSEV